MRRPPRHRPPDAWSGTYPSFWIFYDAGSGLRNQGQKFSLYTAMGIVTTTIFWGIETAFWPIWKTDVMRELGAVVGLSVGYVVKYNLDRILVFNNVKNKILRT